MSTLIGSNDRLYKPGDKVLIEKGSHTWIDLSIVYGDDVVEEYGRCEWEIISVNMDKWNLYPYGITCPAWNDRHAKTKKWTLTWYSAEDCIRLSKAETEANMLVAAEDGVF